MAFLAFFYACFLWGKMMMNPGLYIHVPFCVRKCRYCDFYSQSDVGLVPHYIEALKREMAMVAGEVDFDGEIDTLYFGGGTPSTLEPHQVKDIVAAARSHFPVAHDLEVTLETNPGTVDEAKLAGFYGAGVSRLFVGVQSLNDDTLVFLGRLHSAGQALSILQEARRVGFTNIGGDLIYGIPGQDISDVLSDVEGLLELNLDHLSCYMLTVEEGTPLGRAYDRKEFEMPDDELSGQLFMAVSDSLTKAGFSHYEVSNFARGLEFKSRHNIKYWEETTTLGLGPSAHGYWKEKGKRWWNAASVQG